MWIAVLASALAGEQVTVVGGLSQEFELRAGASSSGALTLRNNTPEPLDVMLSLRDYRFSADGRTDYPAAGSTTGSNAPWIDLAAEQVTLPPGEATDVSWTLAVPATVDAGTHWSVILVEPMGERFRPAPGDRAIGVTTVFRSAVQIVTHVGQADPEVRFLGRRTERTADGRALLGLDVANDGRAWVVPTVWAELTAPDGSTVARAQSTPRRLFPSTSGRFWLDLGALPAGTYEAVVVADGGGDLATGARLPLTWE
jgi:hypothetical protein